MTFNLTTFGSHSLFTLSLFYCEWILRGANAIKTAWPHHPFKLKGHQTLPVPAKWTVTFLDMPASPVLLIWAFKNTINGFKYWKCWKNIGSLKRAKWYSLLHPYWDKNRIIAVEVISPNSEMMPYSLWVTNTFKFKDVLCKQVFPQTLTRLAAGMQIFIM